VAKDAAHSGKSTTDRNTSRLPSLEVSSRYHCHYDGFDLRSISARTTIVPVAGTFFGSLVNHRGSANPPSTIESTLVMSQRSTDGSRARTFVSMLTHCQTRTMLWFVGLAHYQPHHHPNTALLICVCVLRSASICSAPSDFELLV